MALSLELIDYVTITTQNGVTDTLSPQPSDNCHTIVVFNTDSTDGALVGIVPTGNALTTSTAALVPAGGSLTLRIGTQSFRPCGSFTGNRKLKVEGIGATPTVSFQYINSTVETPP
jgi:hypothetical protein